MRHSIARSILRLILLIALAFTSLMVFSTVTTASEDAYEHSQLLAFQAAQSLSFSYSWYEEDVFYSEKFREKVLATMEKLREDDELIFLYIVVPDEEEGTMYYMYLVGDEEASDVVESIHENPVQKRSGFSDAMLAVMNGKSEREDVEINNEYGHVISTYVPLYGEKDDVIAVVGADVSISRMEKSLMHSLPRRLLFSLLIGVISPLILYAYMKKGVIEPTEKISAAMGEFGRNGKYDVPPLELHCDNEFGQIEASFNKMAVNIRNNVERIQKYTEIQNRQAYELRTAAKIQQGFLPDSHWEDETCEISGCMIPAKSIGGDFFDYFTSNGQTILLIADVSGKGLSGAVFMASAITLIRGFAKRFTDPHDVLTAVNQELEHTNANMMFVTVFLAYVDMSRGVIRYCNAGHNPPYLISDGKVRQLTGSGGVPLGILEDEVYDTAEEFLPLGSTLYFYTDGVNEAENADAAFFGNDRLEACLRGCSGRDAVDRVREALREFTADCEQYDDITMLSFTSKAEELLLPAKVSEFAKLRSWILEDARIPEKTGKELCLMGEELFVNIASYAYGEKEGTVLIRKKILPDGNCLLQFTDSGMPFDPTQDITDIEEYDPFMQVGGLGRFMIESMADVWHYTYMDGHNVQLVIKKSEAAEPVSAQGNEQGGEQSSAQGDEHREELGTAQTESTENTERQKL